MSVATPAVHELSRRLVALEDASASDRCAAERVSEKLRRPLVRLAGAAGFRALLSRALALAKAEEPALDPIEIRPDGALDGFDRLARDESVRAGRVVVTHLLGLLMVFVGEALVMGFVREAWPDVLLDGTDEEPGRQR